MSIGSNGITSDDLTNIANIPCHDDARKRVTRMVQGVGEPESMADWLEDPISRFRL